MYIDTHCHISKNDFENIDEIINNIGNNIAIISGCDHEINKEVVKLIDKYPNLYGTIGLHPDQADKDMTTALSFIEQNINNPKIVGIGEIGLDYHYGKENELQQKELFIKQINLALKYNKPIVIHSRDAALDTYEIIKEYSNIKKILHCYSYSLEMAKRFIEINTIFGIGGVVTFKNSQNLKNIVKNLDLKYFVLETDSPYLAPEPFRGQKNEPKNIPIIATKIAEIKDESIESVLCTTTKTALAQFDLPI